MERDLGDNHRQIYQTTLTMDSMRRVGECILNWFNGYIKKSKLRKIINEQVYGWKINCLLN
jgi:hypothetical protein